MPSLSAPSPSGPAAGRWRIAVAGALSLAVAMGIGRFAFTPLLPMMLADGVVDLAAASWLASTNYFGYLVGALFCTLQPWLWRRLGWRTVHGATWVRAGLAATCLLTLGMVVPLPALWPWLRFAAGVASALVFVFTSGWCLAQLAQRGTPALGGMIYTGPGAGIALGGLAASAMVAAHWSAASGWLAFGVLAVALTAVIWRTFRGGDVVTVATTSATAAAPVAYAPGRMELGVFAVAYGLAGFGYIITATFLPVIARAALPGSPWLDLFWPIFGVGVVIGALVATRLPPVRDRRWLLAAAYLLQGSGVLISVWLPTLTGFALGSLLLGLPFTALTFFAMQEARRLLPASAASYMGLLTALYGVGQIVGPALVAWLLARSATPGQGFSLALELAAAALLFSVVIYLALIQRYPVRAD